jgi:hypothetical protein
VIEGQGMKWKVDEHGRLVITVTRREQRRLKATQRQDENARFEPAFDSDAFLHELLEPLVTGDEFTWLAEGCTGDLTSAPMLGILGDEMPGPDEAEAALGTGLVHVGCWHHEERLRQMYRPVLKRWAFMAYQITSPQRELAETGECLWDGGDLWGTQEAAEKGVVEAGGV